MTTESLPRTLVLVGGALFCLTTFPQNKGGDHGGMAIERVKPSHDVISVHREWLHQSTIPQQAVVGFGVGDDHRWEVLYGVAGVTQLRRFHTCGPYGPYHHRPAFF